MLVAALLGPVVLLVLCIRQLLQPQQAVLRALGFVFGGMLHGR
jgi:hypothetical protein